jgi:shikimate kinase
MGVGKTCIGRRLAHRLDLPFVDADKEIEEAAGCSIPDMFERHGEKYFREGERRVILRLLDNPVHVLSTGGGAFMDPQTRAAIRERAISLWLRADLDLMLRRVAAQRPAAAAGGRSPRQAAGADRPALSRLCRGRHHRGQRGRPPEVTLERVIGALAAHIRRMRRRRRKRSGAVIEPDCLRVELGRAAMTS